MKVREVRDVCTFAGKIQWREEIDDAGERGEDWWKDVPEQKARKEPRAQVEARSLARQRIPSRVQHADSRFATAARYICSF